MPYSPGEPDDRRGFDTNYGFFMTILKCAGISILVILVLLVLHMIYGCSTTQKKESIDDCPMIGVSYKNHGWDFDALHDCDYDGKAERKCSYTYNHKTQMVDTVECVYGNNLKLEIK